MILRGRIERMAGAARFEQRRIVRGGGALASMRKQKRERRPNHAGGWSVSIMTSRLVPLSPPQA